MKYLTLIILFILLACNKSEKILQDKSVELINIDSLNNNMRIIEAYLDNVLSEKEMLTIESVVRQDEINMSYYIEEFTHNNCEFLYIQKKHSVNSEIVHNPKCKNH